jgi:hypothetical protein
MKTQKPKTKTIHRTVMVPVTVDGETRVVPETQKFEVPVPPLSLDRIVRRVMTGLALAVVTGAIVWSTVAISELLAATAPYWVALLIAGVFDTAWVVSLMAQWLARNTPRPAREMGGRQLRLPTLAQVFGWAALGLSMALITLHGHVEGDIRVGIAGAAVSAVAKGLVTVVLHSSRIKLDERHMGWVAEKMQDANAVMVVTRAQEEADRTLSRAQDVRLSLGLDIPSVLTVPDKDSGTDGPDKTPPGQDRKALPPGRHDDLSGQRNRSQYARELAARGMGRDAMLAEMTREFPTDARANLVKAVNRAITRANRDVA